MGHTQVKSLQLKFAFIFYCFLSVLGFFNQAAEILQVSTTQSHLSVNLFMP